MKNTRIPAVAGQFYPADAGELKAEVEKYLTSPQLLSLNEGEGNKTPLPSFIKGVVVPHAGYEYSGPVAASAYKVLEGAQYDNVILIGNSHSAYFDGVAIDGHDSWETPLGEIAVNEALAAKLAGADKLISINSSAHDREHSLEVQLPFLQAVLKPGFKIVPILFGNSQDDYYQRLAQVLKDNLGENDLIVISTDLSHYPSYENANRIDQETLAIIKTKEVAKLEKHIEATKAQYIPNEATLVCGVDAVKTVMALANLADWDAEILHYANSGDAASGNKRQVVGYGAVAFFSHNTQRITRNASGELSLEQKDVLLQIARGSVESFVGDGKVAEFTVTDERLQKKEGAFVTLKKAGALRGCIGLITNESEPLWEAVREMAIAAATEDSRFLPVTTAELSSLEYEISVLSEPQVISDWRDIKLGEQGVIIAKGRQKGVFLPQVANETGWDLEKFLTELCSQKAGLAVDCYKNDPEVVIKVFTVQVF